VRAVWWVLCGFYLLAAGSARAEETGEFTSDVQVLFRVAACAGDAPVPARFDAREVAAHCHALDRAVKDFRRHWLRRAGPFFAKLVPAGLPDVVVYPFGGGDLLAALLVFPEAREYTTLSLERAGDVRALGAVPRHQLGEALEAVRGQVIHLFRIAHSRTRDMRLLARRRLPVELIDALVGLAIAGYQPLSLRYFELRPDGTIQYLQRAEIESAGAEAGQRMGNVEIEFQGRGGVRKVFRHIAANLDDAHLETDPAALRHLEAKGRVAAMTKAASYLLWWRSFTRMREYLLGHMEWMVSDSTGIPLEDARAAGFEQVPYGRFVGPFFAGERRKTEAFVRLWQDSPYRPLAFRFGYPDSGGHSHLMVTRRMPSH
jgi:hypothetical protein